MACENCATVSHGNIETCLIVLRRWLAQPKYIILTATQPSAVRGKQCEQQSWVYSTARISNIYT